jgi:hypothetical protein
VDTVFLRALARAHVVHSDENECKYERRRARTAQDVLLLPGFQYLLKEPFLQHLLRTPKFYAVLRCEGEQEREREREGGGGGGG